MGGLKKYFGPSTLVAAAFIGPGTVTVCTLAGVKSGYTLLWAVLVSTVAAILLQEMSARIGLITKAGLGTAIRDQLEPGWLRSAIIVIVCSAIILGNAAYQSGNLSGARLGLDAALGDHPAWIWLIGVLAASLLWSGRYRWIQNFLIGLVLLMSLVFLISLIVIRPSLKDILSSFLSFRTGQSDFISVITLIGTTIVPYNLFLHASLVSQKWHQEQELGALRVENLIAVGLGGMISAMVLITSASTLHGTGIEIQSAAAMAQQLEPLLGSWSKLSFGIGLFAAGLSSALTAPLAAGLAARGLFGWSTDLKDYRFRIVWVSILVCGILVSTLDISALHIIQFAQFANGLALPIMILLLIYLANQKRILGKYTNGIWQNALSALLLLGSLFLSFKGFYSVWTTYFG